MGLGAQEIEKDEGSTLKGELVQSLPRKGQDFAVERSGLVREELDPDALRIGSLEAEVREREMSWVGSTSTSMDSASRGISTGREGKEKQRPLGQREQDLQGVSARWRVLVQRETRQHSRRH